MTGDERRMLAAEIDARKRAQRAKPAPESRGAERSRCSRCRRSFDDPATRGRALGASSGPRAWCRSCDAGKRKRRRLAAKAAVA